MAPVLLCPECGTKHPLEGIGSRSAFPCSGCGRTLKVPAVAHAAADAALPSTPPPPIDDLPWPSASTPAPPVSTLDPHATQTFSAAAVSAPTPQIPPGVEPLGVPVVPAGMATPGAPTPAVLAAGGLGELIPARPIRFLLWIVAVPLAFVIVFALARAVGLLTTNEVTDVALADGWSRFWPIARLLPFVALATAGIVQGGVYGIARLRAKRRGGGRPSAPAAGADGDSGRPPRVRQSSRNGA